jgi:hypothetical protein
MAWWEGLSNALKYKLQRSVKKEKKAADKQTKKDVFGKWEPYTKVRPYLQLKAFICLFILFLGWVAYNHVAGNWPDSGGQFALAFFSAIIGVPIYHIGAALWLVQPVILIQDGYTFSAMVVITKVSPVRMPKEMQKTWGNFFGIV